jgi:hypothetical protein
MTTALIVTSAFAADLAPGKPAGVKKAQENDNTVMIVAGVGIVGLGIGLVASGGSSSPLQAPIVPPTTTTTTTTTG